MQWPELQHWALSSLPSLGLISRSTLPLQRSWRLGDLRKAQLPQRTHMKPGAPPTVMSAMLSELCIFLRLFDKTFDVLDYVLINCPEIIDFHGFSWFFKGFSWFFSSFSLFFVVFHWFFIVFLWYSLKSTVLLLKSSVPLPKINRPLSNSLFFWQKPQSLVFLCTGLEAAYPLQNQKCNISYTSISHRILSTHASWQELPFQAI